ncbi:MAG TPA: nuclear transport factor 2 family protein [Desulfomonilaceae bacterium]|nr:nuclear transport factor 2 family protein [Desulfomonilaceae bacterium]
MMSRFTSFCASLRFCVAVGLFGVFSFLNPPQSAEKVVKDFVTLFQAQDAAGIYSAMHPDVVGGKEISQSDVEEFLKQYKIGTLTFENSRIDRRMKAEDGSTERFQATLTFRGPVLAPEYPKPSVFEMVILWVLEDGKWWLERTFSTNFIVTTDEAYPTRAQDESAIQFEAAIAVLDKIGSDDEGSAALSGSITQGSAAKEYSDLEAIYRTERGPKGVDSKADGIQVLLNGASRSRGGLLDIYYGDFKAGPDDARKPLPWGMFRDYVQASIHSAKSLEKRGNTKAAKNIYRRLISLGRQFLNEPGGIQFAVWGTSFQKQGAQELVRLVGPGEKEQVLAFANVASRRLDLLQTALSCLDDMTDYKSLKSAIFAAGRSNDAIFRPWGINTLSILAFKGAPANQTASSEVGGTVLVRNKIMQKKALSVLKELESESSGKVKSFIANQKEWVTTHNVYGVVRPFK